MLRAMSANFRIRPSLRAGVLVVVVAGDLDRASAPVLGAVLGQVEGDDIDEVLVYMRGVSFVDAAGLGVLAGGYRRLRRVGVPMILVSPRRSVRRALALVGLNSLVVESIIQGTGEVTRRRIRCPLAVEGGQRYERGA
jgi:anti-sigma B factor antagonist